MANESGEYGALYSLTCILYEGAITVTTTGTHKAAGTDLDPSFAFAAEINNGDYVGQSSPPLPLQTRSLGALSTSPSGAMPPKLPRTSGLLSLLAGITGLPRLNL